MARRKITAREIRAGEGWGVEGDEGEKMNIVKKKIIQSGLLRSLLMVRLFNAIP